MAAILDIVAPSCSSAPRPSPDFLRLWEAGARLTNIRPIRCRKSSPRIGKQ
ncbi:MAG: hypothetical protein JKY45_13875 [Emcibacter sp.]|nr:hypothetical protein [Emcibacter sp.]